MVKASSSSFSFYGYAVLLLKFISTISLTWHVLILLYRVHLKQNKYPVLFLSNGPTKRYTPYKDWRCTAFQNGISFAKAEGLLVSTLHVLHGVWLC